MIVVELRQQWYNINMIENILKNIDISENAQKVYLHLLRYGPMPARLLSEKIGMPRPTVYDAVNSLIKASLVISREEDGKSIFSPSDPNALELIIDQRITSLNKSKSEVHNLIPKLREQSKTTEPKIRFFSGKEGVEKILNDILWYKDIETYTLWPIDEMISLLGEEYLAWHNKRRVERNISLKSIRKFGTKLDFVKFPYLADKTNNMREIRYVPSSIEFNMSYWIYADKVTFISTGGHPFGFIVHSQEFSSMQKTHFDLMWNISTKE